MDFDKLITLLDSLTPEQRDGLSEKLWSIMGLNKDLDDIQDDLKRHLENRLNLIRVSVSID